MLDHLGVMDVPEIGRNSIALPLKCGACIEFLKLGKNKSATAVPAFALKANTFAAKRLRSTVEFSSGNLILWGEAVFLCVCDPQQNDSTP
ncbi:MAG: hypothetical protein DWI00_13305 [Planctomycetota bacterium]|nr:MAG: hypothetical protein DWI00_13305 [Planctomycetota bacterium]